MFEGNYISFMSRIQRHLIFILFFTIIPALRVLSLSIDGDSTKRNQSFNFKKDRFLQFGILESTFAVRDLSTSPLIYRGSILGVTVGYCAQSSKRALDINYCFSYGALRTRNYPYYDGGGSSAYNNWADVNYLINVKPKNNSNCYIGLNLGFKGNYRINDKFNNASLNYELFCYTGPIFRFSKFWTIQPHALNAGFFKYPKKQRYYKLTSSLVIPLYSAALRPPYSGINDFVTGNSLFHADNIRYSFIGNFFTISADINFYYYLSNRNAFRISYFWNYYKYNPSYNPVNSVSGSFSFSFMFQLSNK